MTIFQLTLCLAFATSIAVGQMLFKIAADSLVQYTGTFVGSLASSSSVWLAFGWYGISSILWIYILMSVPLSRAYPFALVGAALVPLFAWLFFGERITTTYLAGGGIVVIGLYIIAAQPVPARPAEPLAEITQNNPQ